MSPFALQTPVLFIAHKIYHTAIYKNLISAKYATNLWALFVRKCTIRTMAE